MNASLLWTALRNARHHRSGRCIACGRPGVFLCFDPNARRNNMSCPFCHSASRNRYIARKILEIFAPDARSLVEWGRSGADTAVYNTHVDDIFCRALSDLPNFVCSALLPGRRLGESVNGTATCQDLEQLTFDGDRFDLVISEDVLEHVRQDVRALEQIRRVLKPGGWHVFSVPYDASACTVQRFELRTGGDAPRLPVEYHGDTIRGRIVTYRNYGADFPDLLRSVGFDVAVFTAGPREADGGIFETSVFVTRKCADTGGSPSPEAARPGSAALEGTSCI